MTKNYEQRKESNKRYLKKLDEITVRVPKGEKKELHKFVHTYGYASVNRFIVDAINYYKDVVRSSHLKTPSDDNEKDM